MGYVYLIGTRKFQWYKIGKSYDACIRVRELGILLPFKIEVIAVWKADNHHKLEYLLHEKYAAHRINGEWFRFSAAHVRGICNDLAFAQVPVASGFTNIKQDCKQDGDPVIPQNSKREGKAGRKVQFARLRRKYGLLDEATKPEGPSIQ